MATSKREKGLAELEQMTIEWNCTLREILLEILFVLYTDVFPDEYLEQEFSTRTDEELLEVYLNW